MTKELKIEFAPGAFDNFEGTQEELDELMAEIHRMFESGEALEKARPIDFENPSPEDMELIEHLMSMEEKAEGRTLQ
jgi:hypothetical protein